MLGPMSSFGSCLREDEINELSTFLNGCFDDMENHSNKVVQQSTEDLLELTTLLDDFIDSMSTENFENLSAFFETMPKLQHTVEVKNPKTKKKNEILIEGLQSFFV